MKSIKFKALITAAGFFAISAASAQDTTNKPAPDTSKMPMADTMKMPRHDSSSMSTTTGTANLSMSNSTEDATSPATVSDDKALKKMDKAAKKQAKSEKKIDKANSVKLPD